MEAVSKKTKEFKGGQHSTQVLQVEKLALLRGLCGQCGHGYCSGSEREFKDATCHKYGKVGHISPVCRARVRNLAGVPLKMQGGYQ